MECARYGSLEDLLIERYHFSMPLVVKVPFTLHIIDALSFMHDHRLIHKDVKPANAFLYYLLSTFL
jgi:serine/threonine protein kinase